MRKAAPPYSRAVAWRALLVLALLTTACATKAKPLPQNPPRIPDSPPERRDELNSAARLGLEPEERRWGVAADQELKRQAAEKAQDQAAQSRNKTVVIPMPPPNDGGTFRITDAGAEKAR